MFGAESNSQMNLIGYLRLKKYDIKTLTLAALASQITKCAYWVR